MYLIFSYTILILIFLFNLIFSRSIERCVAEEMNLERERSTLFIIFKAWFEHLYKEMIKIMFKIF